MPYRFSPESMGFYTHELQEDYLRAGSWPTNGVDLSDEEASALLDGARNGKVLTVGGDGRPYLADPPPKSTEELISEQSAQREYLLSAAAKKIAPLQDAMDLSIATEQERDLLLSWKRYRVDLMRLVLTGATFDWPAQPDGLGAAS